MKHLSGVRRVVLLSLLSLGFSVVASAQAERGPSPSDVPPPEQASDAPEGASTPEKVVEAKAPAQLPLIESSPEDPTRPAFRLYAEIDLPVLGIAAVFAASRLVLSRKAHCAPLCDRSELNRLDRRTAGFWSPAWQLSSNISIYALAAGSALFLALDEGIVDALNDSIVIAESALAAMATVSIMTLAANRPRPFLYGEDAPLRERNGSDAGLSFLSSHAAIAFAAATATVMAARRLHPKSYALPLTVGGVGAALAALVAVGRVLGGMHFITDALGGAIVGMSLGVLIPALHKSGARVVPQAGRDARGLSLITRF